MTKTLSAVRAFIDAFDSSLLADEVDQALHAVCFSPCFKDLLLALVETKAYSPELGQQFAAAGAIRGLAPCRRLRSGLNAPLGGFFHLLSELLSSFNLAVGLTWSQFAVRVQQSSRSQQRLLTLLLSGPEGEFYADLVDRLVATDPHAIYPTSSFRESAGFVVSAEDD
jgi:3-dehydroquinate synthase